MQFDEKFNFYQTPVTCVYAMLSEKSAKSEGTVIVGGIIMWQCVTLNINAIRIYKKR